MADFEDSSVSRRIASAQERIRQLGVALAESTVYVDEDEGLSCELSANTVGIALSQEAVLEVFRNEAPGQNWDSKALRMHIILGLWEGNWCSNASTADDMMVVNLQAGIAGLIGDRVLRLNKQGKLALNPQAAADFSPLDTLVDESAAALLSSGGVG